MADIISSVLWNALLRARATVGLGLDEATDPDVVDEIAETELVLTPTTTPPVSKFWSDQRTLAGADETLDLTALTRAVLAAVDLSGLKVQCLKVKAKSTNNAGGLTIEKGDANGYQILGTSAGKVTLPPGACLLLYFPDKLADVDGTHKTVKISGTAADQYDIQIVAG